MSDKNQCRFQHNHRNCKHRRGPSSFWMHDPELIFSELKLAAADSFLDLGCGTGDYSIYASKIVGDSGVVYALDRWKEIIDSLVKTACSQSLKNIRAMDSDITTLLPIADNCVDVCFMATVLHTLNLSKDGKTLFNEIRRVLKPGGLVAVIECKKEDQPFGPPKHIRVSPEEVEDLVTIYGFKKIGLINLGYNYMIKFVVE